MFIKINKSSSINNKTIQPWHCVVILGNFDGVHLAHQKMFALGKEKASQHQSKSLVYTFLPHPARFLSGSADPKMINTQDQKIKLIQNEEVDYLLIEEFDKKFANLSPSQWFENIIIKKLKARAVVSGYDYSFGKNRAGNTEVLAELCHRNNMAYYQLKPFHYKKTLVSSSLIRSLIRDGDFRKANPLLGRNYFIKGQVIRGKGRGKKIGVPTANLCSENEIIPAMGVYISQTEFNGKLMPSVTNIGFNPTFADTPLSIETHLIEHNIDLYDKKIQLHFIKKIREEKKFKSIDALVKQIQNDIEKAKKYFTKVPQH